MREPARLEVLFSRQGDAWRVYLHGWVAPYLRQRLDQHGEAYPVRAPDLADLHDYMWQLDAPYLQAETPAGGMMIDAFGRSAVVLWEWLADGYLAATA